MKNYLTLTDIATKYGRSRQRVHKWLIDNKLVDKCEQLTTPSGKVSQLLVPLDIVERMPFAQPIDNVKEKK